MYNPCRPPLRVCDPVAKPPRMPREACARRHGCLSVHRPSRSSGTSTIAARATAPQIDRGVVDKMPDPLADPDVLALVDLGGLDKLLLQGCRVPPIDHVAGALVLVCAQDKASIMWSEARREHASAPRPPRGLELGFPLTLHGMVGDLDVLASVAGLLLTWVRDLGDHRQFHLRPRHADAPEVAVTHSEDAAIAPHGVCLVELGLVDDLQTLVEVNPAAATGALVAEHLLSDSQGP
eukprot:UN2158